MPLDDPDALTPMLGDLARRQPEAARIVRRLSEMAAAGRWDTDMPPTHIIDQVEAAIRDMRLAWARDDYAAALVYLKMWAALLGVAEGGAAPG
jgi:hypothetical protein